MVRLEDNILEAAIITYNRPQCINEWLKRHASDFKNRNIKLSIYDSSEENDTQLLIAEFNQQGKGIIEYHRVGSCVPVGDKMIIPLTESKAKYIWVIADRRFPDFGELDEFIFPKVRNDSYDVILLQHKAMSSIIGVPVENENVYTDVTDFMLDGWNNIGYIGCSMFRTELFQNFHYDEKLKKELYSRFHTDFLGIGMMAVILSALQKREKEGFRAYGHLVKWTEDMSGTTRTWQSYFYKCFEEPLYVIKYGLCELPYMNRIIRNIIYGSKNFCFCEEMLYIGRIDSDLTDVYDDYEKKGYFDYSFMDKELIKFYAKAPIDEIRKKFIGEAKYGCPDTELVYALNIAMKDIKASGKKIYIYGAGHGGNVILDELIKAGVGIVGFIDQNAIEIKQIKGIRVYTLEEVDPAGSLIIVSIKKIIEEVKKRLIVAGFKGQYIYLCELLMG